MDGITTLGTIGAALLVVDFIDVVLVIVTVEIINTVMARA